MKLLWPTGSDALETLLMPDHLWEAEASKNSWDSLAALVTDGGVTPKDDGMGVGDGDYPEIPPTQPSPTSPVAPLAPQPKELEREPTSGVAEIKEQEGEVKKFEDKKEQEEEVEQHEEKQGEEVKNPEETMEQEEEVEQHEEKQGEEVKNPEEAMEQEEEEVKFPTVSREAQQAFKGSRTNVRKMDAAATGQQSGEPKKKAVKPRKETPMKRPAAKGKAKAKAKAAKMASPVCVPSDAEDVVEVVEPRNLLETFDEAADKPNKEKKRRRNPPAPNTSPKKTKQEKKDKVKAAQLSPIAKKLAKKPRDLKSTRKKDKTKGKQEVTPDKTDETGGKKTFAGRRCPKTSKEAIQRFECLRASFQSCIQPRVSSSISYLEVG